MITIDNKTVDSKLYIQNDKKHYIESDFIKKCEKSIDGRIFFNIDLGEIKFTLDVTREEMKSLAELTTGIAKHL